MPEVNKSDSEQKNPETITNYNSNTVSWNAMLAANQLAEMTSIQDALKPIPTWLYPDNPAQNPLFPSFINHLHVFTPFVVNLLPACFVFMQLISTCNSIKRLYKCDSQDRNWSMYLNLAIQIITTAASLFLMTATLAGCSYILLNVAPILIMSIIGISILQNLFHCIMHIVAAYKEGNKLTHAIGAGKNIFHMALSVLLILSNIELLFKIPKLLSQLDPNNILQEFAILKRVGSVFESVKPLFYSVMALASLGFLTTYTTKAWETHEQTIKFFHSPRQESKTFATEQWTGVTKFYSDVRKMNGLAQVFNFLIVAPLLLGSKLAILVLNFAFKLLSLPIVLLGSGARACCPGVFNKNEAGVDTDSVGNDAQQSYSLSA